MGDAQGPGQSIGWWFRLFHRGDRQPPGRRQTLRAMKQIRRVNKHNQRRHVNDGLDLGSGGLIDSGPLLGP